MKLKLKLLESVARKVNLISKNQKMDLIDVGSADEHIKKLLDINIKYYSMDCDERYKPDYLINLDNSILEIRKVDFDIVLCLETLEHTQRPKESIKFIKDLGKDNAVFFISMPNEYNIYSRLLFLFGIKKSTQEPFEVVNKHLHIHQPRVKDIIHFCQDNFKILEINYYWYSRLANHKYLYWLFRPIDFILNIMAQIYPSMFARNVLILGVKK